MKPNDIYLAEAGSTAWILGNGPSLSDEQISRAEQDVLIVCNDFNRHARWPDIAVDYYIVTEPAWSFQPAERARMEQAIIDSRCTWLIHESIYDHQDEPRVIAMAFFGLNDPYPGIESLVTDLNRPLLGNTTVVNILGIPLALWIGARRIVLAGVDLDYGGKAHFYDADDYQETPFTSTWISECDHRFNLWGQKCSERGVELINATPVGNLSLPRTDWRTL
jgi:hypothetical protein